MSFRERLLNYMMGMSLGPKNPTTISTPITFGGPLITSRPISSGPSTSPGYTFNGLPDMPFAGGGYSLSPERETIAGAWVPGAKTESGDITKAGKRIEDIVGVPLEQITPQQWRKLIKEQPRLITGRADRPGSYDPNYVENLAKRLGYNALPKEERTKFGGKQGQDAWWKTLSAEQKAKIKKAHTPPKDELLQRFALNVLRRNTQGGKWKPGGKERFLSKHDLEHKNVKGSPSTLVTPLKGFGLSSENRAGGAEITRNIR